ncbi:hypothetical protein BREVNS_0615 [Brevinematales bacterium NS]|nr:hypothetical protein BREVNS_0615 [Brevinematales bacterium NS]
MPFFVVLHFHFSKISLFLFFALYYNSILKKGAGDELSV